MNLAWVAAVAIYVAFEKTAAAQPVAQPHRGRWPDRVRRACPRVRPDRHGAPVAIARLRRRPSSAGLPVRFGFYSLRRPEQTARGEAGGVGDAGIAARPWRRRWRRRSAMRADGPAFGGSAAPISPASFFDMRQHHFLVAAARCCGIAWRPCRVRPTALMKGQP